MFLFQKQEAEDENVLFSNLQLGAGRGSSI
jgi:hypothetical protein